MDEQVFKLVQSDELNESFRISVEFEDKIFNLTILQKLKAWMVAVDRKKICSQAKQLELDPDEYYKKIREYLAKTPQNVDLKLGNNEFVINCNLENSMKVKYFACELKEVDYSTCVESLMESYFTDRINSLHRLKTVEEERCEFEKEKNCLEFKLKELIEKKKTDDQVLYNNFVLVLNEKKRRIQHLSELLEAFKRGRPTLNSPVEVKRRKKKSQVKPEVKSEIKKEISESDSDNSSYDTDEEKQQNRQLSDKSLKKEDSADPMPSTSKCDYDLFDDSPPRHLLPKRVKTESSVDVNNFIKHSATKPSSENGNTEKETVTKDSDNSTNVNFNTQDLLDNI